MSLLSWILAIAGFAALAMAMEDHHRWLLACPPTPTARRNYRLAAIMLLAGSWSCASVAWGPAMGSIAWCGLLSFAAAPLIITRTYVTIGRR